MLAEEQHTGEDRVLETHTNFDQYVQKEALVFARPTPVQAKKPDAREFIEYVNSCAGTVGFVGVGLSGKEKLARLGYKTNAPVLVFGTRAFSVHILTNMFCIWQPTRGDGWPVSQTLARRHSDTDKTGRIFCIRVPGFPKADYVVPGIAFGGLVGTEYRTIHFHLSDKEVKSVINWTPYRNAWHLLGTD